jgi:hypothetical protein
VRCSSSGGLTTLHRQPLWVPETHRALRAET